MNKRTARRLAEATAMAVPAVVAFTASGHAAPILATPRANSTVGGRAVTFYASFHAERPVASAKVFLDGRLLAKQTYSPGGVNGLVNVTWDSTTVSSGKYTVSVRLYDAAGNIVSQDRVPIVVNNGPGTDTIPPQVAVITPSQGEEMRGSIDIKVLATDNSGQSPYVSVFVDKQLRGVSNHQPYSYAINTAEYDNGEHLVEAWAYDASQNKGTAEAVRVRFNNPGGATTLNEDVNRMGRAEAVPSAPAPTESALPEISAPGHITPTAAAPAQTPLVHIPPVREVVAPAPPVEPAKAPSASVDIAAEPTPELQTLAPRAETSAAHEDAPARSSGIQELPVPVQTALVPPSPAPGKNVGITELPVPEAPHAPAAVIKSSARPAPPRLARRAEAQLPNKPAPARVTPRRVTRTSAADAMEAAAAAKQAPPPEAAATPEPIVIRMRGDEVLPNPHTEAPVKTRIARAEPTPISAVAPATPRAVSEQSLPLVPAARPQATNPAPRPVHLDPLPTPTAPAVRVHKPAAVAPAPKRVARVVESAPRPVVIPELPADTVRGGRIQHAVRPGETPRRIARAYGVPLKDLTAANNISRRNPPRIGRILDVPTPVRIALNDVPVQFDAAPQVRNGATLAAFRQVYEQAGGRVKWNAARREVRATGGGATIVVHIGSREVLVNGHKQMLDAPAFIEDGRTFLPIRFVADALGLATRYDAQTGSITLNSAARPEPKLA